MTSVIYNLSARPIYRLLLIRHYWPTRRNKINCNMLGYQIVTKVYFGNLPLMAVKYLKTFQINQPYMRLIILKKSKNTSVFPSCLETYIYIYIYIYLAFNVFLRIHWRNWITLKWLLCYWDHIDLVRDVFWTLTIVGILFTCGACSTL